METASTPVNPSFSGRGTDRTFYLPRLPREFYQANAVVHWTLPISQRRTGWLNEIFTQDFVKSCCTPPRAKDFSARRIA
jgi:hypothetical protein